MTTFTTEDRESCYGPYELAINLEAEASEVEYHGTGANWRTLYDAAKVLRMQADEIKALREQLNEQ